MYGILLIYTALVIALTFLGLVIELMLFGPDDSDLFKYGIFSFVISIGIAVYFVGSKENQDFINRDASNEKISTDDYLQIVTEKVVKSGIEKDKYEINIKVYKYLLNSTKEVTKERYDKLNIGEIYIDNASNSKRIIIPMNGTTPQEKGSEK